VYKLGLTPKGPKSQNGFFGILNSLLHRQKHLWFSEIFEEGGRMRENKVKFNSELEKTSYASAAVFFISR
jgi:hypothetical protein